MYFVCLIQLLLPNQINHYYYYYFHNLCEWCTRWSTWAGKSWKLRSWMFEFIQRWLQTHDGVIEHVREQSKTECNCCCHLLIACGPTTHSMRNCITLQLTTAFLLFSYRWQLVVWHSGSTLVSINKVNLLNDNCAGL